MPIPQLALADIGYRAVIEMTKFTRDAFNFEKEVKKMNSMLKNFASDVGEQFRKSNDEISKMGEMTRRVVSIVAGIVVADAFRGMNRAIGEVVSKTAEAIDTFQRLEIQMETILARDFARAKGVSLADAFRETSGQAEVLLSWITKVAVTTPFSAQSVGRVFALANAYGFTTEEAQRMVLTVGDFTASMGASDEVLERIIYNLGQMEAAGRPTGRELRDLSNNFVPIATIADRMGESMGKTRAEIMEMFRVGTISARDFTEAFLEMVEETVPGAMARMSRTFQTVRTNLQDLIQLMLGFRVFGPIASQIAEDLQNVLETILQDEYQNRASAIGTTLLFAYNKLSNVISTSVIPAFKAFFDTLGLGAPTIDRIIEGILKVTAFFAVIGEAVANGLQMVTRGIQSIQNYFATTFEGLADRSENWGGNIIQSFARGMAWAVKSVIQVLNFIGQAIAKLLRPGSPPLLLPDLDVWGAEAMTVYMEGWKNADFSVFNEVGNILERAIDSWKERIGEEEVLTRILGSKSTLAEVVETYREFGVVSESAMNNLVQTIGIASEHIDMFIRKSLELTKFQEIKDEIGDLFDFEGVGTVNLFGNVVSSFEDIIALAGRFGDDISQSIIEYAQSSERLIEVNQLIKQTQDAVNASTKEYDELLARLQAQLNRVKDRREDITRIAQIDKALNKVILTATERERLELEKEQILLEREIRLLKEQRDEEKRIADESIEDLKTEKNELEAKIKEEKKFIQEVSNENVKALENELKALKDIIDAQIALNELINRQINLRKGKTGAGGSGVGTDLDDIPLFEWNMPEIPDQEDITASLDAMWKEVYSNMQAWWSEIKKPFKPVEDAFKETINTWKDIIEDPEFLSGWDNFTTKVHEGLDLIKQFWDDNGEDILESIGTLIGTIISKLFGTSYTEGDSIIEILADAFVKFGETLNENGDKITEFIDGISKFISETTFDKAKEFFEKLVKEVIPGIAKFVAESLPKILDFATLIVNNSDKIIAVASAVAGFILAFEGAKTAGKTALRIGAILTVLKTIPTNTLLLLPGLGPSLFGIYNIFKGISELKEGDFLKGLKENFTSIFTGGSVEAKDIIGPIDWSSLGTDISTWWNTDVKEIFNTGFEEKVIVEPIDWEATSQGISDWWDSLFGEEGKLTTGQNDAQLQLGIWAQETYGVDGVVGTELNNLGTRLGEWWAENFGPEGKLVTGQNENLLQTEEWAKQTYGADGAIDKQLQISSQTFEEWWASKFGEEGTVTKWFSDSYTGFTTWINSIFGEEGSVTLGLKSAKEDIGLWWENLFGEEGTVTKWFRDSWQGFKDWMDDVFGEENGIVPKKFREAKSAIEDWWNGLFGEDGTVSGWFDEVIGKFTTFGENIVQGLIDGLGNKAGDLFDAVVGIIQTALNKGEEASDSQSPSREFMKLAYTWMEGLELGTLKKSGLVYKAVDQVVVTSMDTMMRALSNQYSGLQRTVSSPSAPSQINSNNQYITMQMNPTYQNVQSPSSIYYDMTAAIASIRR